MNDLSRTVDRTAERILVRGVNWLGDAVMTTPALLRLRQAKPDAHIALVTPDKLADLWRDHPALDAVIPLSAGEGVRAAADKIRAGRFDVGVALPNSHRAAIELWLGRVPQRVGYGGAWRNWLLTNPVRRPPGFVPMRKRSPSEIQKLIRSPALPARHSRPSPAHQTHHYLHLVAALGANPEPIAPCISVSDAEASSAIKKFRLPRDRPLFGLNPGAEYGPAKRWPAERFIEAAIAVQVTVNCHWVILGGRGDVALAATIESELKQRATSRGQQAPINLAGRISLRELCAVVKACRVLLTNDTGPMHVAAAVGTPAVVPFGSTSSELTGPGLPGDTRHRLLQSDAICSPCFLRVCPIDFRCMRGIVVERVVQAVLELVSTFPGGAGPEFRDK